jgi:hypothetical protein
VLLAIRRWFVPGQCASACAFVCGNFASVEEAARQLIDDRLAELAHNDTPVPRRRRKGDYPRFSGFMSFLFLEKAIRVMLVLRPVSV